MNRQRSLTLVLAVANLLLISQAHSVVVWSEVTDGDLNFDDVGTFALGTNSIVGTFSLSAANPSGDFDFLTFSIAPGQMLTTVVGTFNSNVDPEDNFYSVTYEYSDLSQTPTFGVNSPKLILSNVPLTTTIFDGLALSAGEYRFCNCGLGRQKDGGTTDYQLDFIVTPFSQEDPPIPSPTPVAEPSTLALLGAGLLGLFVRRKRVA